MAITSRTQNWSGKRFYNPKFFKPSQKLYWKFDAERFFGQKQAEYLGLNIFLAEIKSNILRGKNFPQNQKKDFVLKNYCAK